MSKLLWKPDEKRITEANITDFINFINDKYALSISNYAELYQWSVEEVDKFWEAFWMFSNIIFSKPYDKVVENLDKFPPSTKWFPGARLNFAQNLLRFQDDGIAITFASEDLTPHSISYKDLYRRVSRVVDALRKLGIKPGDRVVGYMPNIMETVVAMLGATALGATWASCGAELGPEAALDRLGQVEPKVMFTVDGYIYKGKRFDQLEKIRKIVPKMPSLEKVVIQPYSLNEFDISDIDKAVLLEDFMGQETDNIEFAQLPFDHPLYIMFSSGTTGKPKCMVQSAGGVLINHMKELLLHTDLKRSDKILYLTSPSWMMWNWVVSSLAIGATVVLYDGNPLYPDWRTIWKLIEQLEVTIFGCSASYLHYLKTVGARPGTEFNLSALREISQTGSALSDEGFEYVYREIKSDLHFNSISGGTDINGCFAAGAPVLPVYSGELQARALGMKVNAYSLDGKPVFDEQAELVCELPSPSMPIYFWNDPNNEKYRRAYFDFFKDKHVWRHGDYIMINSQTGGVKFFGRSDSVLKPSGVRIGTAEIYSIVEELDEIEDSLAIGQQWNNDQRILLFVKIREGYELTDELKNKIKSELRTKASPRHVPALIIQTPDIPYTFSGKKVESAVTNIIHDRPISNRGAMRNPECLEFYEKIAKELSQK